MISPFGRWSFEKNEVIRIAVTGAMPEAVLWGKTAPSGGVPTDHVLDA
jgi:hypothetical protein